MKYRLSALVTLCFFLPSIAFAIVDLPQPVEEDLYFSSGGVRLTDLTYPSDLGATSGTVSGTIEGNGSVTIGDERGGGFPRLMMYGGTNISSQRTFEASETKDWWDGLLETPKKSRVPDTDNISWPTSIDFTKSQFSVLDSYSWGGMNEVFTYSPEAHVVLPVSYANFSKIWLARYSSGNWTVTADDYCVVVEGYCDFPVSSANAVALIRETFSRCPERYVAHGHYGNIPDCRLECDSGYVPNADLSGCVKIDSEEDIWSLWMQSADKDYAARPGYFRFTDSRAQMKTFDTEGISGETRKRLDRINATSNYRQGEEEVVEEETRLSFLTAMKDLRAMLWEEKNELAPAPNVFPGEGNAEGELTPSEEGQTAEAPETLSEEGTHASAPILPRTGPAGIFVGLAVVGFGIMALSARRR
ncbi:MAG: hypothetical protein K9M51_04015 [Candidatus Gracilibacteria bacterium]|nr:hypothetical protein [Candidatus Gracilibacteria bacterium]